MIFAMTMFYYSYFDNKTILKSVIALFKMCVNVFKKKLLDGSVTTLTYYKIQFLFLNIFDVVYVVFSKNGFS